MVLRFLVAPDGSILDHAIAFSSGNADLDQEVLNALSQCRFAPDAEHKEPRPLFVTWPIPKPKAPPPGIQTMKFCERRPSWPPGAREAGKKGTVVMEFLIDENGNVKDRKIIQSSKYADLDKAALEAISLCHFKPSTKDNAPVSAWQQMKYTWNPSD